MKKSLLYFSALAGFLTAFCSCSDDVIEKQSAPTIEGIHEVTLSVEMDNGRTRSTISETGKFSWLPGDIIKVLATDKNFYNFTLMDNVQSTRGEFTGTITGTQTTYAVSPASIAPSAYTVGDPLVLTLPNAFVSKDMQANAPMVAQFAEGETGLQFRNVTGMMMFYVSSIPAGDFTLTVTADNQQLSGDFTVTEDTEGNLVINSAASATENEVAIAYSGKEVAKRAFYIPLPVGTYKNLKVAFTSEAGEWFSKTAKDMTVARNQIIIMPTITCGATPNTVQKSVGSENAANDINELLEEAATAQGSTGTADLNITIAASEGGEGAAEEELVSTVEIKKDLVIPTTITQAETAEAEPAPSVILTFDAVPTSTNTVETATGEVVSNVITITDNTEAPAVAEASKSEIQISIPSVEVNSEDSSTAEVEAPSFNINLPTSTVTLSAKGESALYDVVIANTAENTLRVDRGVTINKVIVGTGNIDLKGTIGDIVSGSGKPIYVFLEEGAEITGTVSANVIIVDRRNPDDDLEAALEFDNEKDADGIKVPYEISRLSQLRRMSVLVNSGKENKNMVPYYKCNYKLVKDIAVGKVEEWEPIGSDGAPFRGTFDGANYTVSGHFNITSGVRYGGLFGVIESATVKNLTVNGSVNYTATKEINPYVGGIAGQMRKGSLIENSYNMANITVKEFVYPDGGRWPAYAGGIVGEAYGWQEPTMIVACGNEGLVTANEAAGIAATSYYNSIYTCYNTANVNYGICEYFGSNVNVIGCWTSSMGLNSLSSNSNVSNCYWNRIYDSYDPINPWWLYNSNIHDCGKFDGNKPEPDQINAMNAACQSVAAGWEFNANAKPVKSDKTGIPSTPIKPW